MSRVVIIGSGWQTRAIALALANAGAEVVRLPALPEIAGALAGSIIADDFYRRPAQSMHGAHSTDRPYLKRKKGRS